jgi:hypothetical protein
LWIRSDPKLFAQAESDPDPKTISALDLAHDQKLEANFALKKTPKCCDFYHEPILLKTRVSIGIGLRAKKKKMKLGF